VLVFAISITFVTNLSLGVWFTSDLYHSIQSNRDRVASTIIQVKELDDRSDDLTKGLIELKADVKHGTAEATKTRKILEEFLKEQRAIEREERLRLRNGNNGLPR